MRFTKRRFLVEQSCVLRSCLAAVCLASSGLAAVASLGLAQEPVKKPETPATGSKPASSDPVAPATKQPQGFSPPPNLVRLAKDFDIWIDPQRKMLIVDGKVALREGQLEMFACPKQTKEHESIVAVNSKAQFIHAGLLALGANPGRPVQFDPEYKPASGPEVEIWVLWKDERGNHKVRAQEWIQQSKTGKELEYPFVFAGSGFHVDEVTGEKYYLAEGGDLICVSNFTTATLDLPVASSQENSALAFRAFTERIPPVGTPVRLVLSPKLKLTKLKSTTKSSSEKREKQPEADKESKKQSQQESKKDTSKDAASK